MHRSKKKLHLNCSGSAKESFKSDSDRVGNSGIFFHLQLAVIL